MSTQPATGVGGVSASASGQAVLGGVPAEAAQAKQPSDLQAVGAPSAVANVVYQGGPIIAEPQVHASFWGASWGDAAHAQHRADLIQFLQDLLVSGYMNILSQYGVGRGAGRCGGWAGSSNLPTVAGSLTDADIHTHVQALIDSGTLPEPGSPASLALLIFLDESVEVDDPGLGIVMCEPQGDDAFGYHYFFTTRAGHKAYYSVVPALDDNCLRESCPQDQGCSLHLAQTQEQRQTQVASHEFSEMVTDPEISAWRDPATGNEIGDICNGQSAPLAVGGRTWTVQRMYSKRDDESGAQACVLTPVTPLSSYLPPYQTRILETGTTFAPETDGTWLMTDWDRDGIPDLVFIKTANTGTGMVEVHVASGASNYQTRILETGTTFAPETDGTWLMADWDRDGIPDLVFIKTDNTPNGHVEVHVASGASNYQDRVLEVPTTFVNETDGTWLMADWDRDGIPDLVFVKTDNTPNGHVEVHVASGASNYQDRVLEVPTTFVNETDGTWLMADWDRDGIPDLVFIKTANTGTGTVEVHVASGASSYQTRILETGTTFAPETDGTWLMADYDPNWIPELTFIKTANTGTGTVEVHIAA